MPISKHRRKGKLRSRDTIDKAGNPLPPQPVTDPENHWWRQDAELMARLQKMYGGNAGRDWTDAQIDAAIDELDRENDAKLMARLRKMYGGNDWPDWTDAQIDAAMVEIAHEQVEARIKRRAAVAEREWRAQRREPQQPELVPINSLAEAS